MRRPNRSNRAAVIAEIPTEYLTSKMHLEIYANRSGRRGDLGLEHVAVAVQRSLLYFQNTVRIREIVAIERCVETPRAHPDRCFERAVRGPCGVVGKSGRNVAQVTPIEAHVAGVVGEGSGVLGADIEFLLRYTGNRFSGLSSTRPLKCGVYRCEFCLIVGTAGAQQQRFKGLEINLSFKPLAL